MSRIPIKWRGEVVGRNGAVLWRGEERDTRIEAYRDASRGRRSVGYNTTIRARATKRVDSETINSFFRRIK